jgi:hypothetical protein
MWRPSPKQPQLQRGSLERSSTAGARDQSGRQIPYHEDPLRNPAASLIPNGYLAPGYDTGRKK